MKPLSDLEITICKMMNIALEDFLKNKEVTQRKADEDTAIARLKAQEIAGIKPDSSQEQVAALKVCRQLGIYPEDYQKQVERNRRQAEEAAAVDRAKRRALLGK